MHLDKKTITILVICTLASGIVGGVAGAIIGANHSTNGLRRGQGMMMDGRGGTYGSPSGMYQRGGSQNARPIDYQGAPTGVPDEAN